MGQVTVAGINCDTGRFAIVDNQGSKLNERSEYYALRVEDLSGQHSWFVLFTEKEMERLKYISPFDMKNIMTSGRLYQTASVETFYIRVTLPNETVDGVVRISRGFLKTASMRSDKNVQDVWQKGFFKDLFEKK